MFSRHNRWCHGDELVDIFFSKRLQDLLDNHGMTGQDLEDEGIISASSVREYLENDRLPNLRTACRIAEFFSVSLDWLCGIGENVLTPEYKFRDFEKEKKAPWL